MIVQTMTADIRHCARLRKINNVTHLSWRGKDLLSSFDDNIIAALIELLINIPVKGARKLDFFSLSKTSYVLLSTSLIFTRPNLSPKVWK